MQRELGYRVYLLWGKRERKRKGKGEIGAVSSEEGWRKREKQRETEREGERGEEDLRSTCFGGKGEIGGGRNLLLK